MTTAERNFVSGSTDTTASGVSWGSIFAGAAAAAALSMILLVLGVGLGFSAISPWANSGAKATTLGVASILWLVLTQIAASGIGGYLAGRLRIKWTTVHTDEVYFRDTAHGLLAWAVASLVAAALIGSVAGNVISSGASAGAKLAGTAVGISGVAAAASPGMSTDAATSNNANNNSGNDGMMRYMTDSLFRSVQSSPDTTPVDSTSRVEVIRIFANSIHSTNLPPQDQQYLAQVIAKRTGLSVADADKRVSDTFNTVHTAIENAEQRAKQAADNARKAAAYTALWMFVALLCGAFVASFAATIGGKQRDNVRHTDFAA